jgi:O-methyltransferase
MIAGENTARFNVKKWAIDLAKKLSLKRGLLAATTYLPQSLQDWIWQLQTRRFFEQCDADGFIIVPIEELKQKQREALTYLCAKVGAENIGDYLEFGVYSGSSLSCMYQVLQEFTLDQVRLFGFDSFEGMPPISSREDEGTWQPGQFKFSIYYTKEILTRRGIDWNRVVLTKGWYCDTLKPQLIQQYQIQKASVIMVDCDLYSSTCDVLRFCQPLIQGPTIIFFDDWDTNQLAQKNLGEKRAFDEFLQANPDYTVEEFGGYDDHSNGFIVTPIAPATD